MLHVMHRRIVLLSARPGDVVWREAGSSRVAFAPRPKRGCKFGRPSADQAAKARSEVAAKGLDTVRRACVLRNIRFDHKRYALENIRDMCHSHLGHGRCSEFIRLCLLGSLGAQSRVLQHCTLQSLHRGVRTFSGSLVILFSARPWRRRGVDRLQRPGSCCYCYSSPCHVSAGA